ncbi:UDP-N-acetylmuramoylalanyl-D-glutamate--2, 6-diaminopimelate ligase [Nitrosomonas sp. PY1]|uniref:UDP-N-acetylmuramoyl-L-alanyl-D-glutamate--2, 6-diaminopimelate ligase n=1 Tax=Nitrosomonas sp. PY1 TaxID=1803906 RepID=UPI001FC88CF1|nr:UDP-N-acetylmuramoyl-L-alanyl-D-glutamate--2,6-diaminopimelate ligase [Nitrosomonas sp. PY1]GKS68127.1 UDP-N-acetylmuramoylalanyl-D-glutamate--2, 6-diaminopimelate ligase [Nitrosomonas sp. PY1]
MTIKRKTAKLFDLNGLNNLGIAITNLVSDSREIKLGDTFVAYAGEEIDRRKFIPNAIAAGANAILWDPQGFSWNSVWNIPSLPVPELKVNAGFIASHVYENPSRHLWMVGVTGTNGKTSFSHWYAQAMLYLNKKMAIIGTLGNGFYDALAPTENTTPDALILQRLLAGFLQQGADGVVMEVSSHGIAQERINGTTFSVAVLTNLSRDHLDYHQNMDAYADTKARLFFWPELKYAVINLDDVLGVELSRQLKHKMVQTIGYGFKSSEYVNMVKNESVVLGSNLHADMHGIEFDIEYEGSYEHLKVPVLGKFNAYNLLAVAATLLASGVPLSKAVQALQHVYAIPGRMEQYTGNNQVTVIIDYAHTPDALEKVLYTLQEMLRSSQQDTSSGAHNALLHCVVGCGGNRDKGKRAMIGEVATRLADTVIFTSDNPRNEDPPSILRDITSGTQKNNYQIEVDRALAIYQAIDNACAGDIVLVAGKGHEKFQEIKGEKIPFSDADVVCQVLHDIGNKAQVLS